MSGQFTRKYCRRGGASARLVSMRLVGPSRAAALLALLLCLVCLGAGFTDFPIEDAGYWVAAECSLSVVQEIVGIRLAAPVPLIRASYAAYDARLYRAELTRVKRWGS